jgi:protein-tyrosine-phosphatase
MPTVLLTLVLLLCSTTPAMLQPTAYYKAYLDARAGEFGQIAPERRAQLDSLAQLLRTQYAPSGKLQLTCICTHNSRRSHLAMIWAAAAAHYYGLRGVTTYSGGTEATAFNPRAVDAVRRAGLPVVAETDGPNPTYLVTLAADEPPLRCFSKAYTHASNPQADYVALMVCSHADENCPVVFGAKARFALPYRDPKASDGTPQEAATYDERCADIARELLYVFSQLKS